MTVSYGFYNGVAHDRMYDTAQISAMFDGLISDGVFMSIGTSMHVVPGVGLNVIVGKGRAWFDKTWTYNDADLVLPIGAPDAILPRIDTVILETDSSVGVRANSIKILSGVPATNPVPAALTKTLTKNQYPLAYLSVAVGAASFIQANITNKVGTSDCPYVTGILDTVNIDNLIAQWESEYDTWLAEQDLDFDTWFDAMKGQLTTDAAGNLQNQINVITGSHTPDDTAIPASPAPSLTALFNFFAASIKRITGKASWVTAPAVNLESLKNFITLIRRVGGDSTYWGFAGTTVYNPASAKLSFGVTHYTSGGGRVFSGQHVFSLGEVYADGYFPLLFAVPVYADNSSGMVYVGRVDQYIDNGRIFFKVPPDDGIGITQCNFLWIAIGRN